MYLFLERRKEEEREEKKQQCVVVSCKPPNGDLARNLGIRPDRNRTGDPLVCRPAALNPLSHTR